MKKLRINNETLLRWMIVLLVFCMCGVLMQIIAPEFPEHAAAVGILFFAMAAVLGRKIKKGDVFTVAQVAGIMGTKRTSELIPMCHPLSLTNAAVTFDVDEDACDITVYCKAVTDGKTGVEMEALTGVSVTLLTIYDMCKAIDKRMLISDIHLTEKTGGKSGDFRYIPPANDRASGI